VEALGAPLSACRVSPVSWLGTRPAGALSALEHRPVIRLRDDAKPMKSLKRRLTDVTTIPWNDSDAYRRSPRRIRLIAAP
jgi:hypothetical protein